MSGQVETRIDNRDAGARNLEILRHEVRIKATGGDEAIDLLAMFANQLKALTAKGLRKRFEVEVVSLERAQHRDAQVRAAPVTGLRLAWRE